MVSASSRKPGEEDGVPGRSSWDSEPRTVRRAKRKVVVSKNRRARTPSKCAHEYWRKLTSF